MELLAKIILMTIFFFLSGAGIFCLYSAILILNAVMGVTK